MPPAPKRAPSSAPATAPLVSASPPKAYHILDPRAEVRGVKHTEQGKARGVDGPAARVVLVALQRAQRLADFLAGLVPAFDKRI